jgi:ATP-binding cassette, subfamily B, bacterial
VGGRLVAVGGAVRMAWRAQRGVFLLRLAITVVAGLAPVASAWLMRSVLDDIAEGRRSGSNAPLVWIVLALAMASGLSAVLPNISQYLSAEFGRAIERLASSDLFAAVTRLSGLRRLEDPAFQDRLRMAQQAGRSGPSQVFTNGVGIVQATLTLVGFLITLIVLNPLMAGIVVVATVPEIYVQLAMSRRRADMIVGISHAERRQYFYSDLISSHAAAKEVRLFGLGTFFHRRMLAELTDIQRAGHTADRRELFAHTGLAMISAVVAGGGLLWSVDAAVRGALTLGDVSIFVAALVTVGFTLGMIVNNIAMTYQALVMFQFYRDIVEQQPDLPMAENPLQVAPLRDGITFEDVWFRYGPDRPWILSGVSFTITPGSTVALVGHNGAGKSTLVKLICRFYDPDIGRILWDDVDLRDLDLAGLRQRMSVVFQDYMTYELSAAENIAVGDIDAALPENGAVPDRDLLHAAADRAGIHGVLKALPKGYDTLLTQTFFDLADKDDPQTGVMLSGGQWQRLALARSFLRTGRDFVILDEPSAGLDAEAEHEIHRGLREHRQGRATLLVSHRLNAVRDADRIIVLVGGRITEDGDHAALIALGGTYARMFGLQASGYGDAIDGSAVNDQHESVTAISYT